MPEVRRATEADVGQVVELLTLAFYDDPTWSWAFPDAERRLEQYRIVWGLYVRSAPPHGLVSRTGDGGAVALWLAPDETELSEDDDARMDLLLRDLIDSHADEVEVLLEGF